MSLDAESQALLNELKAEFAKPKKGQAPSAAGKKGGGSAQRTWVSPDGRKHLVATREDNREPGATRPEDGANEIAHSEAFLAVWQPEARETWVMSQQCRCCTLTTVYIAGEYIRFRRRPVLAFGKYPVEPKDKAHVWRRTEHFPDLWLMEHALPRQTVERDQSVEQCAVCLRTERTVDTLWSVMQRAMSREVDVELSIPGIDTELPQREAQHESGHVVPESHPTGQFGFIWPTTQRNPTMPPVEALKGVIA